MTESHTETNLRCYLYHISEFIDFIWIYSQTKRTICIAYVSGKSKGALATPNATQSFENHTDCLCNVAPYTSLKRELCSCLYQCLLCVFGVFFVSIFDAVRVPCVSLCVVHAYVSFIFPSEAANRTDLITSI